MRTFVLAAIAACFVIASPAGAQSSRPDILEIIEISGEITESTVKTLAGQVENVGENAKVKAVLLVVNSPGGGVGASSAVYEELSKLKVPVVGWCDGLCASGGMYALMAPSVKFIGLRAETIAGSVGVIASSTRFNRLLDKVYIDNDVYKSGPLKDAMSSTRGPTDEDRKYIQGLVDHLAENFYAVVGGVRKITDWSAVKSARVFIGKQAVQVGLADAVMTRDAAIQKAKDLSGSKSIHTRTELKKMSTAADERVSRYGYGTELPAIQMLTGDLAWIVGQLKEIRNGESVRFQYRMPYVF